MLKTSSILKSIVLLMMAIFATNHSYAQFNGGNIASPYSMFGIGDMRTAGTAQERSMGGVSYALRDPFSINMANPAALSGAPTQSFLFAAGVEGVNSYLRTSTMSTSNNAVNLGYIGVKFPISKGLGFGFSLSPYSSVGYSIRKIDKRQEVIENIGNINYLYTGKGDIGQYKMGFGWQLFKGFSIGANFIYYLGTLNHDVEIETNPYVSDNLYASIHKQENIKFNKPSFEASFQYQIRLTETSSITIAGVFQPKINQKINIDYLVTSDMGMFLDTLTNNNNKQNFSFPQKIAGGIAYTDSRFTVSLDYTNEDFSQSFAGYMLEDNVMYKAKNTYSFGFEFIPNRHEYDIRKYYNRVSYRAGVRYSDSYYTYEGKDIDELAITIGLGIPFNPSKYSGIAGINVGLEYAVRGTTNYGLIQTHYLNFFVDVYLFSRTQWFVRHKNH